MTHVWPSRIRETTTTTGTGPYTLAGAVTGYRTFAAALGEGDTVDACIRLGANWELGRYTFTSGALARTAIFLSTNGDAAVNWGSGSKDVFATLVPYTDLDATGIANLGLLLDALGISGTPSTGQFPRFTGAAQVEGLSASAFRTAIGLAIGSDVQAFDADLAAIAALTTTSFGRSLLELANAGAALTALGLSANGASLVTAANYAAMRALLDLEAGTDFLTPSASDTAYAKRGKWQAVREVTAASGTVASSDAGGLIRMNRASSQTLNIPLDSSDPIPVDSDISGQQLGAGAVTIDAPSGVTLNGVNGGNAVVSRRYGGFTLTKIGADEWTLAGAHYPVT